MNAPQRERGFGAIMAIVVVVIMASLAAALARVGTAQQSGLTQDLLSARAWVAARAGIEWGLFRALSSTTPADAWKTCSAQTQTLDLSATTGFHVAVYCDSTAYNEGESVPGTANVVRLFRIEATACNSSVSCPDPAMATAPGYIERVRQAIATN